MSREATGEVRFISGVWTTRVRTFGRREPFKLPTCTSEEDAEACAAEVIGLLEPRRLDASGAR